MNLRHLLLGTALLLTLAATWYVGQTPPAADDLLAGPADRVSPATAPSRTAATPWTAPPAPTPAPTLPTPATAPATPPEHAGAAPTARMQPAAADLFAAHDWQPPAPPPAPVVEVAAAPPPPRVAPPLPFRYLGRLEEPDGSVAVFLLRSGQERQPIVVRAGDLIAPHHRVDQIGPRGLRLTYLPLDQTQNLPFATTP